MWITFWGKLLFPGHGFIIADFGLFFKGFGRFLLASGTLYGLFVLITFVDLLMVLP